MNCPACQTVLIVLEHDDVEVDFCPSCRGVWLDSGELELILGSASAVETALGGRADAIRVKERTRRCPMCGKRMAKKRTTGDNPVVYDECRQGHGLWFDAGELDAVVKRGIGSGKQDAVSGFLRAVFVEDKAVCPQRD